MFLANYFDMGVWFFSPDEAYIDNLYADDLHSLFVCVLFHYMHSGLKDKKH